jgi:DNA-binding response OmpR family regulator
MRRSERERSPTINASHDAPLAADPISLRNSPGSIPSDDPRPGILLVEDDLGLLHLVATALQREGFAVWPASSGRAALEIFQRERDRIDVALLDVRMPGLDGPHTLVELRRLHPDLACCFMSGYAGAYTTDDLLALGAIHCFDKPFRLEEVAQRLREVVARQAAQA